MGKGKHSRRFVQQGKNAVKQHDQQFTYHSTYAEAEAEKMQNVKNSSLGGH
ncbi:hypothetical protein [Bacillus fonticola]|uniref:hypothetical protein n=1 Tax=Bacillus fonticola TaxID=2728853 RepID=UPI001472DB59|nr:hypothetical protein [Bacillus fonticola]